MHDDNVTISANQLNGDVLSAADGIALSDKRIAYGRPYKVKAVPAPGFTYTGIVLTHGYNLDGPQYVHGNKQFDVETYPPPHSMLIMNTLFQQQRSVAKCASKDCSPQVPQAIYTAESLSPSSL